MPISIVSRPSDSRYGDIRTPEGQWTAHDARPERTGCTRRHEDRRLLRFIQSPRFPGVYRVGQRRAATGLRHAAKGSEIEKCSSTLSLRTSLAAGSSATGAFCCWLPSRVKTQQVAGEEVAPRQRSAAEHGLPALSSRRVTGRGRRCLLSTLHCVGALYCTCTCRPDRASRRCYLLLQGRRRDGPGEICPHLVMTAGRRQVQHRARHRREMNRQMSRAAVPRSVLASWRRRAATVSFCKTLAGPRRGRTMVAGAEGGCWLQCAKWISRIWQEGAGIPLFKTPWTVRTAGVAWAVE